MQKVRDQAFMAESLLMICRIDALSLGWAVLFMNSLAVLSS